MSRDQDLLLAFALGDLDATAARAFERACLQSPSLNAEARALVEALALVGANAPAVDAPSPALKARLLAAAAGEGRLAKWTDRLARFFDVTSDKARALLDAAAAPDTWDLDSLPGVALMHLNAGPRLALADAGLVRFPAGLHWPQHRHLGEERMLVLAGGFRDDAGNRYAPGDELVMATGSVHALDIDAGEACLCAVTLFDGLEMPPGNRVPH